MTTLQKTTWTIDAKFESSKGVPSFVGEAYSGGLLPVDGFEVPVVVELISASFRDEQTPLLFQHDQTRQLGHANKQAITATNIELVGLISNKNADTEDVVHAAKNGKKHKLSIGAEFPDPDYIEAGKSISVNGQVLTGPFLLAKNASIYEVSVVSVPADSKTSLEIAATKKDKPMADTLKPESLEVAANEAQRVSDIMSITATYGHPQIEVEGKKVALAAHAIRTKQDPKQVELECKVQSLEAKSKPGASIGATGNTDHDQLKNTLVASLAINHFGVKAETIEKELGDQAMQAAHSKEFRGYGIKDVFLRVIHAAGKTFNGSLNSDDFIVAAFQASNELKASGTTTLGLSQIFEDVLGKSLLNSFMLANSVWRSFTGITSAPDFKPLKRYRLTESGGFRPVADDGALKHVSLKEDKRTIEMDTEGAMISFTRKMILSDDLGALQNITSRIGRMGAVTLEEGAFKLLLGQIGTFFTAGNGNYIDGADTVLAPSSMATARQKFRDRVDSNNNPILTSPSTLLVGTALESTANSLYNDEYFAVGLKSRGASEPRVERVINEHRGSYQPVVSPYMNNAAIKDVEGNAIPNQSAAHWFLLADPNEYPVLEAAFLNGQQTPIVRTSEMSFEKLGIQMSGHIDFGFATAEEEGAVYSKGAA